MNPLTAPLFEGPLLWYLNRGTGIVLLVVMTLTVVLGLVSVAQGPALRARVPRFVAQNLHRNLALITLAMLVVHVVTAVLDEYVDIRWWQSFVPWQLRYEPWPLALGVIAFDLMLLAVVTSLFRDRIRPRLWRAMHLMTYVAVVASLLHGYVIGTDSATGWVQWAYAASVAGLLVLLAVRLTLAAVRRGSARTTVEVTKPLPARPPAAAPAATPVQATTDPHPHLHAHRGGVR